MSNQDTTGGGASSRAPPQPSFVDRRNAKALEEHRKFGLAPLAKDALTGEDISPHVPTHMATAPWYWKKQQELAGAEGAAGNALTLAHHRVEQKDHTARMDVETTVVKASAASSSSTSTSINRTTAAPGGGSLFASKSAASGGSAPARFTVGACQNCGSMSHKELACLRPKRAAGAAVTNKIEGDTYLISNQVKQVGGRNQPDAAAAASSSGGSLSSQLQQQSAAGGVKRDYEQKHSMAFTSNTRLSFAAAQEQYKEGKKLQKSLAAIAALTNKDALLGAAVDIATGAPGTLASHLKSDNAVDARKRFDAKSGAEGTSAVGGIESGGALPKYLENLDNETTFFDPRSRSMRGDPNALKRLTNKAAAMDLVVKDGEEIPEEEDDDEYEDPAATASMNVFQGDNATLYTEGYADYLEQQYSFVTGKTSKFVDMSADSKINKFKMLGAGGKGEGDGSVGVVHAAAANNKGSLVASALYAEDESGSSSVIGEKRPRSDE